MKPMKNLTQKIGFCLETVPPNFSILKNHYSCKNGFMVEIDRTISLNLQTVKVKPIESKSHIKPLRLSIYTNSQTQTIETGMRVSSLSNE